MCARYEAKIKASLPRIFKLTQYYRTDKRNGSHFLENHWTATKTFFNFVADSEQRFLKITDLFEND